jgi:tRNA modification GTPase
MPRKRFTNEDHAILESVGELRHLAVVNKIDKVSTERVDVVRSKIAKQRSKIERVSARTGEGLEELKKSIIEPFAPQDVSSNGFLVTDARHHDLLTRAKLEIEQSIELLDQKQSEEIVLVGLHNAMRYLGEITGETTTEDMLTRIFSTFCIGK